MRIISLQCVVVCHRDVFETLCVELLKLYYLKISISCSRTYKSMTSGSHNWVEANAANKFINEPNSKFAHHFFLTSFEIRSTRTWTRVKYANEFKIKFDRRSWRMLKIWGCYYCYCVGNGEPSCRSWYQPASTARGDLLKQTTEGTFSLLTAAN